jgi:hypothetical protein
VNPGDLETFRHISQKANLAAGKQRKQVLAFRHKEPEDQSAVVRRGVNPASGSGVDGQNVPRPKTVLRPSAIARSRSALQESEQNAPFLEFPLFRSRETAQFKRQTIVGVFHELILELTTSSKGKLVK